MDRKHSIVLPSLTGEIKAEAKELSHCVASYISNVISGSTLIVFMRDTKKLEESLLTVEIKNGKIVQVKGLRNRAPSESENKSLVKFANEKNLEYTR